MLFSDQKHTAYVFTDIGVTLFVMLFVMRAYNVYSKADGSKQFGCILAVAQVAMMCPCLTNIATTIPWMMVFLEEK